MHASNAYYLFNLYLKLSVSQAQVNSSEQNQQQNNIIPGYKISYKTSHLAKCFLLWQLYEIPFDQTRALL